MYGIKGDLKVSMRGKVIQKFPYMGKIISLFKNHFVEGHQGHPAERMITVRSYMNKTSQYITGNKNTVPMCEGF